jgi:pimeloyl-ACP methyl ester carboxylesterase
MTTTRTPSTGFDSRSRWVDLSGPVHYMDFGGPASGPMVVAVHGLGGSCLNWSAIAPLLTGRCRVLAPDLAGHGLTESLGRATTVSANRGLLHRFIEAVPQAPVILMGNSMGGMLSLLEAAAASDAIAGLILLDAALPFAPALPNPAVAAMFAAYGIPGLGRFILIRRRREDPERIVRTILDLCCVDPSRVPAGVVREHVEMVRKRSHFVGIEDDFLSAARSVVTSAAAAPGVGYRRAIHSIRIPVLLVHGERDRLVPVAASVAAARHDPSWQLVILPDIGHVPQLESPADTAAAIFTWMDGAGAPAVRDASPGGRHTR